MNQLVSMPWLLANITVKYMDIISRVLVRHTTGNFIVTDGPCLLGYQVKKGEDSSYMQICSTAKIFTNTDQYRIPFLHKDGPIYTVKEQYSVDGFHVHCQCSFTV